MKDFNKMTDAEHLLQMKTFVDDDIEFAKNIVPKVCDDCLIMKFLRTYDKVHWNGIAAGLSMALGCVEDEEIEVTITHWLSHIVKLLEDDKILDAETIEEK